MASQQFKEDVANALGAMYPTADFQGELGKQWDDALNVLTDVQVSESLHYLRTRYGTGPHENPQYCPVPSQFILWSRGRGTNLGGVGGEYVRYVTPAEDGQAPTVEYSSIPLPQRAVRYVSLHERRRRKAQLGLLVAGRLKSPLSRSEGYALLASNDPVDPDVLGMRNKLRAALGWSLLSTEGHEEAR